MRPRDLDRVAERDGRRARVLLDDVDADARWLRRDDVDGAAGPGARGQLRELAFEIDLEPLGEVAREADPEVGPRVRLRDERLHVVERDRVEAGDGAEHGVPVRRAGEEVALQPLLAELLFVVGAQVLHERVGLRRSSRA
jgi:hypothetical protein